MSKRFNILTFILYLALVILACNSNPSKKANTINPNGDSELALLMREMFDKSMEAKKDLENNQSIEAIERFDHMKVVEATEPEKANSLLYKSMADSYLASVDAMNNAPASHEKFNIMVDNCMGCHKAMCPGPMVKIKRLYLEEGSK